MNLLQKIALAANAMPDRANRGKLKGSGDNR